MPMEKTSTKKTRLFYLDDNEINIELLKINFEDNYEVIGETDPEAAIKYLSENEVDVILTDQIMPYMDGIEFLENIKDIQPHVARILLTGVVNQEVMLKAINKVNIYRFHEKSDNFDALKLDIDNAFKMIETYREKEFYQKQMLEASEKYKIISENVPAQIIQTDLNGTIQEVNKDFGSIKTDSIGRNILEFIPESEAKSFQEAMQKVGRTGRYLHIVTRAFNFYENYNWHSTIIGLLHSKNHNTKGYLMVTEDITERVNNEEKIMSAVIEAEDRQKSRIARDIHDGLQQTLTIALMNFESVGNIFELLPKDKAEKYMRAFQHLEQGLHDTRNIAYSLIPKAVEDFGYIETVKSLLEELNDSFDINFNFYTNLKDRIESQNIEYNLFRITQESINNILKYAEAHEVFIQLIIQDNLLQLTIEDDGKGFDYDGSISSKSTSSFGLFNMQKRAESLSGKMIIDSTPKKGTLIYVEIPLK